MSLIPLLALVVGMASAQDAVGYAAHLDTAKTALAAQDWKAARAALDAAEAAAPTNEALITAQDLGRLFFYRGLIEWRAGDKEKGAPGWWRKANAIAPGFAPDADLLPETDAQDLYYALNGEIKQLAQVTVALPEDPGDVVIFVSGRRLEASDSISPGVQFVQMRCSEGNLVGAWYEYGPPPPDYLVLCSGGTYPAPKGGAKPPKVAKAPKATPEPKESAADKRAAEKAQKEREKMAAEAAALVAKEREYAAEREAAAKSIAAKEAADRVAVEQAAKAAATDKAAADKAAADKAAAATKTSSDKAAAIAAAEQAAKDAAERAAKDKAAKAAADKAAAEAAAKDAAALAEKTAAEKAAADKATKAVAKATKEPKKPSDESSAAGWAMIGTGAAMLAGGTALNFLVVNPAWEEAQAANAAPSSVTADQATGILERFNTGRYATVGLIAGGAAIAGVGVFVGPLDARLVITPTGVGLTGRW